MIQLETRSSSRKARALGEYALCLLFWTVSPLMIRAVSGFLPVLLLNLIRSAVAISFLWAIVLLNLKPSGIGASLRSLPGLGLKFLALGLLQFGQQLLVVSAFYLVFPGLVTLLEETGILFSVLLAFLFFADERSTVKNPVFLLGILLALAGLFLAVLGGQSLSSVRLNLGVALVAASSLFWSLYSALVKLWLPSFPPVLGSALVFSLAPPLCLIVHLLSSGSFTLPGVPPGMWLVLIFSSLLGIAAAQTLYYSCLPVLGLTLTASLGLLRPLFTLGLSFLVFGERLRPLQFLGGALLLLGCYLVIRIRFRHI